MSEFNWTSAEFEGQEWIVDDLRPLWPDDKLSRRARRRLRRERPALEKSPCPEHPDGFVIFMRWADGTEERKCGMPGCDWFEFGPIDPEHQS